MAPQIAFNKDTQF